MTELHFRKFVTRQPSDKTETLLVFPPTTLFRDRQKQQTISTVRGDDDGDGQVITKIDTMETMRFDVETATESISDLRLQVVEVGAGDSQQQEAKGPRRPRWFRERTLTPQDEIVDRLVDANTAHVTWTTHRPVRGWVFLNQESCPFVIDQSYDF